MSWIRNTGLFIGTILLLLPEEIQLCEREAGGKLHRAQVPGHQQHLRTQLFLLGKRKINSLKRIVFPHRKKKNQRLDKNRFSS
jgi:hypothetical protein